MWLFIFILLFIPNSTFAHPGNTDASGCHTCRTNCSSWGLSTGEYHCHNAKSLPQPKEPIKSTYGDGGTGYTQPAPEYKNTYTGPSKSNNTNTTNEGSGDGWGWLFGTAGLAGVGYWIAKINK